MLCYSFIHSARRIHDWRFKCVLLKKNSKAHIANELSLFKRITFLNNFFQN